MCWMPFRNIVPVVMAPSGELSALSSMLLRFSAKAFAVPSGSTGWTSMSPPTVRSAPFAEDVEGEAGRRGLSEGDVARERSLEARIDLEMGEVAGERDVVGARAARDVE